MFRRSPFLVACLVLLSSAGSACANPANQAATWQHFGKLIPERLQSCALCHVGAEGDEAADLDEFPHNSFGNAMRIAGQQLLDEGMDDTIADRIPRISDSDADGDGFSNLVEILLGSLPGDGTDIPSPEALDRQDDVLTAYRAKLADYRWRPFESVERPPVPSDEGHWAHNPVDLFIANKHRQAGLHPQPETRPEYLLRRVYLDLIGLTPTPDEVDTFVREYSSDPRAYDRVVDRLLSHPGYGERWGRHWMDIWRYSDWAGYKDALRESQRHIWHWRDWIIESLNRDLGYDEMVRRMLAADEMQLGAEEVRATGYLARNYFTNRDQWMDNVVKHTSQAFLGITLGCAKCHDHMSDSFAQSEYYALRAVFESHDIRTDRVPGELDLAKDGIPRAYDRTLTAQTYLFERGDERFPRKDQPIAPGVPEILGGELEITPVSLSAEASRPDQRAFVMDDLLAASERKITAAEHELQRAAAEKSHQALQAELALEMEEAKGLATDSETWQARAKEIVVLQRAAEKLEADWLLHREQEKLKAREESLRQLEGSSDSAAKNKAKQALDAARKALKTAEDRAKKADASVHAELTSDFKRRDQSVFPAESSGRRLAFANWLVNSQNPLTARVAVNHIWARHFGRGLVPTVHDFGAGGQPPTHPALLDWLASELIRSGWSMKSLHRLIVTSATYRMASTSTMANETIDPDNQFYWRGPTRRMEGELVRDNLLRLAGQLDASMGGPDIDHQLAEQSPRRSIYLRHAHEKLVEFIQIFDGPAVSECYQRETSIQPHQALALVNGQLSNQAAEAIADELEQTAGADDLQFIDRLFLRVLGRKPDEDEIAACQSFLGDSDHPRRNLALVLLNHNDFVTIR